MATKHNANCMKTLTSLKSVFVLAIVLLATSCHDSEGMRSHADYALSPDTRSGDGLCASSRAADRLSHRAHFFEQGHEGSACYVSYQYITIKYCP